jgi:hypothetical protein
VLACPPLGRRSSALFLNGCVGSTSSWWWSREVRTVVSSFGARLRRHGGVVGFTRLLPCKAVAEVVGCAAVFG